MVSLLWKEARERLLWEAALALISVYAACTRGYTFYGAPGPETINWSTGPILIAFLMGASGYTGELTSRRAVFLLTRPVTWHSLLLAKLAVSAVALAVAALAAAVAYRFTCPAAYQACAAAPGPEVGIRGAMLLTGLAYLVGLSCSSVAAGTAESAALVVVQGIVLVCVFRAIGQWHDGWLWLIMQALWPVPLAAAGLLVARSGLTLSARERLRRYAIAASACVVLFPALAALIPAPLVNKAVGGNLEPKRIDWSISPDGLHALGRDMKNLYWLDIRRDKVTRLENIYQDYSGIRVILENVGWCAPHRAYRIGYDENTWSIRCYEWSGGKVDHRDIAMGALDGREGYPNEILSSPDGRYAAVSLSTGMDLPQRVVFADVTANRKLEQSVMRAVDGSAWWQSENVFRASDACGGTDHQLTFSESHASP